MLLRHRLCNEMYFKVNKTRKYIIRNYYSWVPRLALIVTRDVYSTLEKRRYHRPLQTEPPVPGRGGDWPPGLYEQRSWGGKPSLTVGSCTVSVWVPDYHRWTHCQCGKTTETRQSEVSTWQDHCCGMVGSGDARQGSGLWKIIHMFYSKSIEGSNSIRADNYLIVTHIWQS